MAQYDVQNDTTPANNLVVKTLPTISAMRTSLNTFSASTYTTAVLDAMTDNDMVYACKVNNLHPAGL